MHKSDISLGGRALTIETGKDDRVANMRAFAAAGLAFLVKTLER